ncbi:hypothetical protein SAMN04488115_107294 [Bosea lathyri]|uniref:Uncharacterized protein n=1 Tax=Bosea lathyri TaxID=1036778 RepID=A0A1H6BJQ8_9HYPH|nr:hypothetical protein SAMN04488115_107294 [Bosea lathyri]
MRDAAQERRETFVPSDNLLFYEFEYGLRHFDRPPGIIFHVEKHRSISRGLSVGRAGAVFQRRVGSSIRPLRPQGRV